MVPSALSALVVPTDRPDPQVRQRDRETERQRDRETESKKEKGRSVMKQNSPSAADAKKLFISSTLYAIFSANTKTLHNYLFPYRNKKEEIY